MSPPNDPSDGSNKTVPTVRPPGPLPPPDTTSIAALRNWLILRADRDAQKERGARFRATSAESRLPLDPASSPASRRAGQSRALRAFLDSQPAPAVFNGDASTLAQSEKLVRAIYPFAKGPELANDEMGYGETTIDVLRRYDPASRIVTPLTDRLCRRTKSGRQRIPETDAKRDPTADVGRPKAVGEIEQKEGATPPSGATGAATQRARSAGANKTTQKAPRPRRKRPRRK